MLARAFYRAVELRPVKAAIEKVFQQAASRTDIPFAVRFVNGSEYRTGPSAPGSRLHLGPVVRPLC